MSEDRDIETDIPPGEITEPAGEAAFLDRPEVDTPPDPLADPTAGIPSQEDYDREALRVTLMQFRTEYAKAKTTWHLARAGVKGAPGHLNQITEGLANIHKAIDEVERLLREGLPEPMGGQTIYLPDGDGQEPG